MWLENCLTFLSFKFFSLLEDIDNINMATDPRPSISGNYYRGPNCSHLCFTGDDFPLIKCLWSERMSESIGQCGFS